MKLILKMVVLFISVVSPCYASEALVSKQTFLTVENYPYQQLVRLSDKVLIHYTEAENEVHCKVEVQHNEMKRLSEEVTVAKSKFTKDALRACFERREAKASLSWVYYNR